MSIFDKGLNVQKVPARLLLNPVHAISLGFGSGLSPIAPGTAGTLMAIPLYIFMLNVTEWSYLSPLVFMSVVLAMFLVGVACSHYTGKALGVTDHGAIVWDEVVGFFITMFAIPPHATNLIWLVTGFFVFRFFDIVKPWPIRWVDTFVKGGFGVMLDDVLAGIYSAVVLYLCYIWLV